MCSTTFCLACNQPLPLGCQNAMGGPAYPVLSPSNNVQTTATSSNVPAAVNVSVPCPVNPGTAYDGKISQAIANASAGGLLMQGGSSYTASTDGVSPGVLSITLINNNSLDMNTIAADIGAAITQSGLPINPGSVQIVTGQAFGVPIPANAQTVPATNAQIVTGIGAPTVPPASTPGGAGGSLQLNFGNLLNSLKLVMPNFNWGSVPWWVWAIGVVLAILVIRGVTAL
jgi:hypothetical protein